VNVTIAKHLTLKNVRLYSSGVGAGCQPFASTGLAPINGGRSGSSRQTKYE